jgi:hypothetical protein
MWARIAEFILAAWLLLSPFVLNSPIFNDWLTALFIILFASLSFIDKLNKMHLFQVLPASWLLYTAYSYPTPILPFYMQNDLLVALTLLVFAIIPSHVSDHPRPWKEFLKHHSTK